MIEKWLNYTPQTPKFCFEFVQITEKSTPNFQLIKELQKKILTTYSSENMYLNHLKTKTPEEIKKYVMNNIPNDKNQFDLNVRQGDFGEILAALIANKFQNRETFNKLKWKFNNNKSVFGTDIIAYDSDKTFSKLYYYEVKTRQSIKNKEKPDYNETLQYITVIAHNTFVNDMKLQNENVLNFFAKLAEEKQDYDLAQKLIDLSLHPDKINKSFEVFIITDTKTFDEKVLSELHSLPPTLSPLTVTIVLIDNFKEFVKAVWQDIENTGVELVQGLNND